jgi:hypothetical protein
MRTYSESERGERAHLWVKALHSSDRGVPLRTLYKGESWSRTVQLAQVAATMGYAADVFVASAGLGLRSIDSTAPAYAATFARGHLDSIASNSLDSRDWWQQLNGLLGQHFPRDYDEYLVVLSEAYLSAISPMIETAVVDQLPSRVVVIGGSSEVDGVVRVRARKDLRSALGGTATSLNQRMAAQWLRLADGDSIAGESVQKDWDRWVQGSAQKESFARRQLTDEQVRSEIRNQIASIPKVSASRGLRDLRSRGFACEQSRYGRLFKEESTNA